MAILFYVTVSSHSVAELLGCTVWRLPSPILLQGRRSGCFSRAASLLVFINTVNVTQSDVELNSLKVIQQYGGSVLEETLEKGMVRVNT